MISTEPGADDVLEARIRQALAGEWFSIPTTTITGRMSRHRRRTWVAAVTVAVATAAAVAPLLSSIGTDRAPVIKPPVILPGPSGTTLDEACQSAGLAELADVGELRPAERTALPPLRFASDLEGVRIYASNRVELVCQWSAAAQRVDLGYGRAATLNARLWGRDLDHLARTGWHGSYVIGGVPAGVVAVEVELSDGKVIPARVTGDVFVAWWDGSTPQTRVIEVTAIGPDAVYTRGELDTPAGAEMTTGADPIGDACEQFSSYSHLELTAASEALGYRIYTGGALTAYCTSTGRHADPVQMTAAEGPTSAGGTPLPTVLTANAGAGEVTFVLGRGNPVDVDLRIGSVRLRPAVHDGFYVAAMPGTPDPADVLHWTLVYPSVIYAGIDRTVTSVVER